jgi:hypothetical protein
MGPIHLPISPGEEWQGCEPNHSAPSTATAKNYRAITFHSHMSLWPNASLTNGQLYCPLYFGIIMKKEKSTAIPVTGHGGP